MQRKRVVFATISLMLVACTTTNDKHVVEGGRVETGPPALHAIRNTQLREMMDKMDSLMQERFMTETEIDSQRRKYAQNIAQNAESMAKTVDSIIAYMPNLQLTPSEQNTFLALAKKLSEQIQRLHENATQNHIDAIDESLHIINTTCTSCHALYRKTGRQYER